MVVVMSELDSCISLDQDIRNSGLNEEFGIGTVIEMVELNVRCVVLSVRV